MGVSELFRRKQNHGTSFKVDAVAPAKAALRECRLADCLELRSGEAIIGMPDGDTPAIVSERLGRSVEYLDTPDAKPQEDFEDVLSGRRQPSHYEPQFVHPLIEAVHVAFAQHRPLILSPDAVWLVISQGFAHHIHQNAEALRKRLVRHAGRKALQLEVTEIGQELWPQFIQTFSSLIREASDPVLHETLICDFSTTSPAIRTASEVAIMDAYERYFRYQLVCICGIPEITVTGTPEDWRRMQERVEVLATYELERWVSRLRPILREFVATAEGKPDPDFWKAIYKPQPVYGDRVATGWVADLFPYLRRSDRFFRNPVLNQPRVDWGVPCQHGISPNAFPSGLSKVPVKVTDGSSGASEAMNLLGGFCAVGQGGAEKLALFPIIHWAVSKPAARPTGEVSSSVVELPRCDSDGRCETSS